MPEYVNAVGDLVSNFSVQSQQDFNRLKELGIQNPESLAQFIFRVAQEKDVSRVVSVLPEIEKTFPGNAAIASAACDVWNVIKKKSLALASSERAVKIESQNYKYAIQHTLCLLASNHLEAARDHFDSIRSLLPEGDAKACSVLAQVAFRLSKYNQSVEYYERALRLEPDNHTLHYSLGAVQRFLGNFKEAEQAFDDALKLNPREYEAYYIRSTLRKQCEENNHIAQMKEILGQQDIHPMGRAFLCYALSKELDDLGLYDDSFSWLSQGAQVRRGILDYDVTKEVSVMEEIMACFSSDLLNRNNNNDQNEEPIFIVGLPRTGSTLAERIISSHSRVESAGELSELPLLMSEMVSRMNSDKPLSTYDKVRASLDISMSGFGEAYIRRVREKGFQGRFIDKLPLNYLNIGLIHLALPKARVIWTRRDPVETCFAMYKTLFSRAYPFTYNLEEMAQYYAGFNRLMAHWVECLPDKIYQLDYEALVQNQEEESRKLLEFCGLGWEEAVLQFEQNQAPSTTASAVQVRAPIYKTSLSKSRPYQSQLAGLVRQLQQAGVVA